MTIIYVHLGWKEQKSTGLMIGLLLGITSIVVYFGLLVIGFDDGWDLKDIPGVSHVDGVVTVTQQFDNVGKFFSSIF
jgi:hypothetical protein